jgi:hypothetical protein
VIRLRLANGQFQHFDNFIDLFDFLIEDMIARGEL